MDALADISVIVPAAGAGLRMGSELPKQYLQVCGKSILEHTVEKLLSLGPKELVLVVRESDARIHSLTVSTRCQVTTGGEERADSVMRGIRSLDTDPNDWVMVHDVVRPCVRVEDIIALVEAVRGHGTGGLLGIPVTDTIKRVSRGRVETTLDRAGLWRAQTPQMFRCGVLSRALGTNPGTFTDEASAVEALGFEPVMVQGHSDNIKITTRDDLDLAAHFLGRSGSG